MALAGTLSNKFLTTKNYIVKIYTGNRIKIKIINIQDVLQYKRIVGSNEYNAWTQTKNYKCKKYMDSNKSYWKL